MENEEQEFFEYFYKKERRYRTAIAILICVILALLLRM